MSPYKEILNNIYYASNYPSERKRYFQFIKEDIEGSNSNTLDNVFYNLDLDRVNKDVAQKLFEFTESKSGELAFRKQVLDCCKDKWKGFMRNPYWWV